MRKRFFFFDPLKTFYLYAKKKQNKNKNKQNLLNYQLYPYNQAVHHNTIPHGMIQRFFYMLEIICHVINLNIQDKNDMSLNSSPDPEKPNSFKV